MAWCLCKASKSLFFFIFQRCLFPFEYHQAFEVEFMKYFRSNEKNRIKHKRNTTGHKKCTFTYGTRETTFFSGELESAELRGRDQRKTDEIWISHFISQVDYSPHQEREKKVRRRNWNNYSVVSELARFRI